MSTMRFVDILLVEFDREAGLTRQVLERLQGDRLDWQPHPRSRTLGQLALHLAELPRWGASVAAGAEFDLEQMPATPSASPANVAGLLTLFEANSSEARRAVSTRTDAELLAPWTLRRAGDEVFTVPRLMAVRTVLLQHATHHRGQLTVYLRLLDVPLPPLYGPTADEGRW
jgi:uncharacterized damage-inducible protein DinB